jgi:hypothetical protein
LPADQAGEVWALLVATGSSAHVALTALGLEDLGSLGDVSHDSELGTWMCVGKKFMTCFEAMKAVLSDSWDDFITTYVRGCSDLRALTLSVGWLKGSENMAGNGIPRKVSNSPKCVFEKLRGHKSPCGLFVIATSVQD